MRRSAGLDLPRVIGHRGAAGHAPENTLASFARAAELGVRWVEFDARLTRDGHVVVFHDETLERTTGGAGRVDGTDLADLKRLDAGGWFGAEFRGERIPTLAEAVAILRDLGLGANVEMKSTPGRERETGAAVARVLDAEWPGGCAASLLLSSFDADALAAAAAAAPDIARAYLVNRIPRDWRSRLDSLACASLHCLHRRLSRRAAEGVREAGYALRCFTVNDPARAALLFEWGVGSVFSDYPDRLGDLSWSGPAAERPSTPP